jgi:chromosome segregation ATPase
MLLTAAAITGSSRTPDRGRLISLVSALATRVSTLCTTNRELVAATTAASTSATSAMTALEDKLNAVAAQLGIAESSREAMINAITLLQNSVATAQQQRDDAVTERETTAAALQKEVTAANDTATAVCDLLLDLGETLGVGTSSPNEVRTHFR